MPLIVYVQKFLVFNFHWGKWNLHDNEKWCKTWNLNGTEQF